MEAKASKEFKPLKGEDFAPIIDTLTDVETLQKAATDVRRAPNQPCAQRACPVSLEPTSCMANTRAVCPCPHSRRRLWMLSSTKERRR